jgi:hypothetical protein
VGCGTGEAEEDKSDSPGGGSKCLAFLQYHVPSFRKAFGEWSGLRRGHAKKNWAKFYNINFAI